jgi:hypothetical protein
MNSSAKVGGRRGDPSSAALLDGFQAGRMHPDELPDGSLVSQAAKFP